LNTARAASIHARLLNLARAQGEDFSLVLNRYGVERWQATHEKITMHLD
jgi:hypothetical protein